MSTAKDPRTSDVGDEFDGNVCLVLPRNFLQTADAASELYEDELARVATNLEVDGLRPSPLRHAALRMLAVAVVWLGVSPWIVCV